jgi:hypothetical protein
LGKGLGNVQENEPWAEEGVSGSFIRSKTESLFPGNYSILVYIKIMTQLSQMGLGSEATRAINGVICLDILVEIGLSSCPIPCISLHDLNVFFFMCFVRLWKRLPLL